MQLLSPAGNMQSLIAAVQNGADGVYFGGGAFNARRNAANFSEEEIQAAIDYCHARGVRAFIALNTLLTDRELPEARGFAAFLCRAGADAAIVQDWGLADILRRELPELPLHASTQMGIHSIEGARAAEGMGLQCAVLARELPLGRIRAIHDAVPIALEAFAHGALCMSVSGACLYSSMVGERSGNRGVCAQPCRKRACVKALPGQGDYCLSLSDLCMLDCLDDMAQAGVDWLKIEGRMKRAEYVAVVTHAYRRALDGASLEERRALKRDMLAMFNRGEGRTGYFYGDDGVTGCVAGAEPPAALCRAAAQTYAQEARKQPVDLRLCVRQNQPATLTMALGDAAVTAQGEVPEVAQKPQQAARYAEQVQKLGDTPFFARKVEADVDAYAFLPLRALNELRRQATEALLQALCVRRAVAAAPTYSAPKPRGPGEAGKPRVTAIVRCATQAYAAAQAGADEIALEPWRYDAREWQALQDIRRRAKLLISLPAAAMHAGECERLRDIAALGLVDGGIAANIGQLAWLQGLELRIAGTQMNVLNTAALRALQDRGFTRVTLSLELTKPQMRDILAAQGAAVSVYGRAQLMQLLHCPLKESRGCKGCEGEGILYDEAGRAFPLSGIRQNGGCLVRMLNCLPTDILDLVGELPPPEGLQLAFYDETPAQVTGRVRAAVLARGGETVAPPQNFTRGHWNRTVI
ncbi:MAG: DUF3656 domain-containing protein [Christensenellaceae bacterium]|jgi:putative protease|nr:DUF3656 domain-containing protein [Christensenellaceae bacterium]